MKKFLVLCAALFALVACSKDTLEGSTWSGTDTTGDGIIATLTFAATTFTMDLSGNSDGAQLSATIAGDYAYEKSEVTLIGKTLKFNGVTMDAGAPMKGTIKGNKLELTVLDNGMLFVKK